MVRISIFHVIALIALLFAPFNPSQEDVYNEIDILKSKQVLGCAPDRTALLAILADEPQITLLPGSGSYVWKINTTNDSAQAYFNQAINTYYGFHIIESLASFKKAAQLDPQNPMAWWGQALALGPNINDIGYSASPEALDAVSKSLALIASATPLEQALIKAMAVRYSADSTISREDLNEAYAQAMKLVFENNPNSADAAALYADAMMLQHPWDLWNLNGTPKAWTPAIREVLEKGLKLNSKHPGIHHYYIHVMEPSPTPEKAKTSADVLGSITPGLAHLVHMPSHIYLRTGDFSKGTAINQQAVNTYRLYQQRFPPVSNNAFIYEWHNQHMLANCAMHAGKYSAAINAALQLRQAIDSGSLYFEPPLGSLIQYLYMSPVLINVRFEKWDSLLLMERPADALPYAQLLYEFGIGMANAANNNTTVARASVDKIDQLVQNKSLHIEMAPFSAAIEGAKTAREMLVGVIHMKEKEFDKATNHLTTAAETEEQMVYNEPRDWFLNPHQYLGMAYLAAGKFAEAENTFRKDLKMNAKNLWSLRGLLAAQQKQHKKKDAAQTAKLLRQMNGEADINLASLQF